MQVQGSSGTGENMYEHYIYGADGKADGLKIHSDAATDVKILVS
jgi:hypothetical protein